jgi:hypothetical protein
VLERRHRVVHDVACRKLREESHGIGFVGRAMLRAIVILFLAHVTYVRHFASKSYDTFTRELLKIVQRTTLRRHQARRRREINRDIHGCSKMCVCVQLYYPQILLAAIVFEIVGGALFAFGLASGAFMLV